MGNPIKSKNYNAIDINMPLKIFFLKSNSFISDSLSTNLLISILYNLYIIPNSIKKVILE